MGDVSALPNEVLARFQGREAHQRVEEGREEDAADTVDIRAEAEFKIGGTGFQEAQAGDAIGSFIADLGQENDQIADAGVWWEGGLMERDVGGSRGGVDLDEGEVVGRLVIQLIQVNRLGADGKLAGANRVSG